MLVNHTLEPVYNNNSKVLILGSMPSVKSRELMFYYAHPQNRFWKTLERVFDTKIGDSINLKKEFLYKNNIALFDVIKSCDITGSSDSSIKNVIPNDIRKIIEETNINVVFTVGRKAYNLYNKYCYKDTLIKAIYLPSTSAANCPKDIDDILYREFSKIKEYTNS